MAIPSTGFTYVPSKHCEVGAQVSAPCGISCSSIPWIWEMMMDMPGTKLTLGLKGLFHPVYKNECLAIQHFGDFGRLTIQWPSPTKREQNVETRSNYTQAYLSLLVVLILGHFRGQGNYGSLISDGHCRYPYSPLVRSISGMNFLEQIQDFSKKSDSQRWFPYRDLLSSCLMTRSAGSPKFPVIPWLFP